MRDEKTWEARTLPKRIEELPLRIQQDLKNIKSPVDLPALNSYFIHGPVHSGKTILAVFLYLEAEKQNFINATYSDIRFIKATDIIVNIKEAFSQKDVSEFTYIRELIEVDFLVIDDFGMEKTSEWLLSTLHMLIDGRYENLKTTIFTSNLSLEEIADNLGDDRIPSRIERMCKILEMKKQYR